MAESEFGGEWGTNTLPKKKRGPMLTASEKARMARITGDMTGESEISRRAWHGEDPTTPLPDTTSTT